MKLKKPITSAEPSTVSSSASVVSSPPLEGLSEIGAKVLPRTNFIQGPRTRQPAAPPPSWMLPTLDFRVLDGPTDNLFLQTNSLAAHAVVSSTPKVRAIATFPSGNAGVAIFADRALPENRNLTLSAGMLSPATPINDGQAVSVELTANTSHFTLGQVVLDSLRSIREVTEGNGQALPLLPEQESLQTAPRVVSTETETQAVFERRDLSGKKYQMVLRFPPNTRVTFDNNAVHVKAPGEGALAFTLEARVPFPPLKPFPVEKLLNPVALKRLRQLDPTDPRTKQLTLAVESLRFLSYESVMGPDGQPAPYSDKFLAGSWRFETYSVATPCCRRSWQRSFSRPRRLKPRWEA
jgi:hypothetical protein